MPEINVPAPEADVTVPVTTNNPAPAVDPTPSGEDKTPETLVFTQDALNAMLGKEKKTGERKVMKMFGVNDEKALETELASYNAYKTALAAQETDVQKLQRELDDHSKTKAERDNAIKERDQLLQEKVLKGDKYKVKDEDMDYYVFQINKLVDDDTDFTAAAEKYFTAHPAKQTPPPFSVGAGQDQVANKKPNMNDFIFGSLQK